MALSALLATKSVRTRCTCAVCDVDAPRDAGQAAEVVTSAMESRRQLSDPTSAAAAVADTEG